MSYRDRVRSFTRKADRLLDQYEAEAEEHGDRDQKLRVLSCRLQIARLSVLYGGERR